MPRRKSRNKTGIDQLSAVESSALWISFACIKCGQQSKTTIDSAEIIDENTALQQEAWSCAFCNFVHAKDVELPLTGVDGTDTPYSNWNEEYRTHGSVGLERFWKAFFRSSVASKDNYWKQCKTCARVQPATAFHRHVGWGPLEKQLECSQCKAVINAELNPQRTKEQLYESATRRRIADLLLKDDNQPPTHKDLFDRFNSRCFKTGKKLDINNRNEWHVDHTLPSKYLYPLTTQNATLLSKEANGAKSEKWPSQFYSNKELVELAGITGQNIELLASETPIVNEDIDVDKAVSRMLNVRNSSDLSKRVSELRLLIESNSLEDRLSSANKQMLGY